MNTANHLTNAMAGQPKNDEAKSEYRDACDDYKDNPADEVGGLDTSGLSYGATLPANKQ